MSDLPQLQTALIAAASRRNRRARLRASLVGLSLLAGVVIAAAAAIDGTERERSAEPPPTPGLTAREVADRFAVLRDDARLTELPDRPGPRIARGGQTYLVREQANRSFYVTVTDDEICESLFRAGGSGSGGCTRKEGFAQLATSGALSVTGSSNGALVHALVPDGTSDARITYRDGTVEPLPVVDNMVVVLATKPPDTIAWTQPNGERYSAGLGSALGSFRDEPPDICRGPFGRLGPDAVAQARRSALEQAPNLNLKNLTIVDAYRATRATRATAAADAVEQLCGPKRRRRTVVIEVTFTNGAKRGQMLVARRYGRYDVWNVATPR